MKQHLPRLISCLIGLAVLGAIVAEVLKKWHLIAKSLSPAWVIVAIWLIFMVKEAASAFFLRDKANPSPRLLKTVTIIINIMLLVIFIGTVISIPFIWFGAIEETAHKANLVP
jgi:hypothetical protein